MIYEKTKHLRHSRQENRWNRVVNVNPNTVPKKRLKKRNPKRQANYLCLVKAFMKLL